MTPQIGKASVEATAPPRDTGGERVAPVTPPVDVAGAAGSAADADRADDASGADNRNLS